MAMVCRFLASQKLFRHVGVGEERATGARVYTAAFPLRDAKTLGGGVLIATHDEHGARAHVFGLTDDLGQALLAEVPRLDQRKHDFTPIEGEIPSPIDPPPGCHFHPRCPKVMAVCSEAAPALTKRGDGRIIACHLEEPAGGPPA